MSKTKHTPGELTCDKSIGHLFCIDGKPIAIGVSNPKKDVYANRMVLTWNCHDDLLAACKELVAAYESVGGPLAVDKSVAVAKAAIDKTKGGK